MWSLPSPPTSLAPGETNSECVWLLAASGLSGATLNVSLPPLPKTFESPRPTLSAGSLPSPAAVAGLDLVVAVATEDDRIAVELRRWRCGGRIGRLLAVTDEGDTHRLRVPVPVDDHTLDVRVPELPPDADHVDGHAGERRRTV